MSIHKVSVNADYQSANAKLDGDHEFKMNMFFL